jgi:hypothetical protein
MKFTQYKHVIENYFTFYLQNGSWLCRFLYRKVFNIYLVQQPCPVEHFRSIKENNGVLNEFDGTSSQTKRQQ